MRFSSENSVEPVLIKLWWKTDENTHWPDLSSQARTVRFVTPGVATSSTWALWRVKITKSATTSTCTTCRSAGGSRKTSAPTQTPAVEPSPPARWMETTRRSEVPTKYQIYILIFSFNAVWMSLSFFLYFSPTCVSLRRTSKPATEFCGRPAHPEVRRWRDLS